MRLKRLKVDGLGPLREVDVDFDALGPGLIAIAGTTGSGKSTLNDACTTAPWYLSMVSHKGASVWDHVPDVLDLEVTWEIGGADYVFCLSGTKDKKTMILRLPTGKEVGPNEKRYLAGVNQLVPNRELLTATSVAVQKGSGSFFRLPRGERYSVFSEMLGIGKWEAWATMAGKQALDAERLIPDVEAKVREMTRCQQDAVDARVRIAALDEELETLTREVETHRIDLNTRTILKAEMDAANQITREQNAGQRTRLDDWSATLIELERRYAAASHASDRAGLQAQYDRVAEDAAEARQALSMAEGQSATAQTALMDLVARRDECEGIVSEANNTLSREQRRRAALVDNLTGLAEGVDLVDLSIDICRKCPLTAEGQKAKGTLATDMDCHVETITALRASVAEQNVMLDDLTPQIADAENTANTTLVALSNALGAVDALERQGRDLETALQQAGTDNTEDLHKRIQEAKVIVDEATRQIALAVILIDPEGDHMIEFLHRTLRDRETRMGEVRSEKATDTGRLHELDRVVESFATESARLIQLVAGKDEYRALQLACTDVRKAEIRDAGPAVSEIATSLLRGFSDGRFEIALETIVPRLTGGGEKEDFRVSIIDTSADAKRTSVSGGETDICDEALRGALSIYRAERSGIAMQTIIRDEMSGGLDPATALEYCQMLRSIRERSGAFQILTVAHSEAVQMQCDRRLVVADGHVTVQ